MKVSEDQLLRIQRSPQTPQQSFVVSLPVRLEQKILILGIDIYILYVFVDSTFYLLRGSLFIHGFFQLPPTS